MGTKYPGTPREVKALNAYITLSRAADTVASRVLSTVAEDGLTGSQFGLLEALHHLGPMCQADLARKILKSSGNITMVVDNLEKRRLVKRVRSQEDRRFVTIYLTDKGREVIKKVLPRHVAAIVETMGALTQEEQDDLRRLCRKLGLRE